MYHIRISQSVVRLNNNKSFLSIAFENSHTNCPCNSITDSPKIRNKITAGSSRYSRSAGVSRRTVLPKAKSFAHDIVVVREASKKANDEIDTDLQRLQVNLDIT